MRDTLGGETTIADPLRITWRVRATIKRMGTRDPVTKFCLLLEALRTERQLTVIEAANRMGVRVPRARAVINRCAKCVSWIETAREGRHKIVRLKGLRQSEATMDVAIAASLGSSIATLFEGTRLQRGMEDALRFVVSASRTPDRFEQLDRRFLFLPGGGETGFDDRGRTLDVLVRAVLDRRVVDFLYVSSDAKRPRRIRAEPWAIAVHRHRLYLLGRGPEPTPWVWRFARMSDVRALSRKTFAYPSPSAFNPKEMFRDSFGIWLQPTAKPVEVHLRLARRWASYARAHRWHPTQTLKTRRDGTLDVKLTVKVCRELREWILSFGRDAEVVAPGHLREEIAAELGAAHARYAAHDKPIRTSTRR